MPELRSVPAYERIPPGGLGLFRSRVLVIVLTHKYLTCAHCGARTRFSRAPLVPDVNWRTAPSVFDAALQAAFDAQTPAGTCTFDLRCRGCARPLRLVYEYGERHQGGPPHVNVTRVIECAE